MDVLMPEDQGWKAQGVCHGCTYARSTGMESAGYLTWRYLCPKVRDGRRRVFDMDVLMPEAQWRNA